MTEGQAELVTLLFAIGVTFIILAYDVAAFYAWGDPATISRVVQVAFRRWPILAPLLFVWLGIMIGHWRF